MVRAHVPQGFVQMRERSLLCAVMGFARQEDLLAPLLQGLFV